MTSDNQQPAIADRMTEQTAQLGEKIKWLAAELSQMEDFDGVFVVGVREFNDAELTQRRIFFVTATACAVARADECRSSAEGVECALLTMARKAIDAREGKGAGR